MLSELVRLSNRLLLPRVCQVINAFYSSAACRPGVDYHVVEGALGLDAALGSAVWSYRGLVCSPARYLGNKAIA